MRMRVVQPERAGLLQRVQRDDGQGTARDTAGTRNPRQRGLQQNPLPSSPAPAQHCPAGPRDSTASGMFNLYKGLMEIKQSI